MLFDVCVLQFACIVKDKTKTLPEAPLVLALPIGGQAQDIRESPLLASTPARRPIFVERDCTTLQSQSRPSTNINSPRKQMYLQRKGMSSLTPDHGVHTVLQFQLSIHCIRIVCGHHNLCGTSAALIHNMWDFKAQAKLAGYNWIVRAHCRRRRRTDVC